MLDNMLMYYKHELPAVGTYTVHRVSVMYLEFFSEG